MNFFPEKILDLFQKYTMPLFFSIDKSTSINQYGCATTTHIKATKICSLAGDWEGLITKQHTSKQIILGMVLHR